MTTQNQIMMTILTVIGFLVKMGSVKMMNTLMMMKTIKMLEWTFQVAISYRNFLRDLETGWFVGVTKPIMMLSKKC